jgi:hypothetical protein
MNIPPNAYVLAGQERLRRIEGLARENRFHVLRPTVSIEFQPSNELSHKSARTCATVFYCRYQCQRSRAAA